MRNQEKYFGSIWIYDEHRFLKPKRISRLTIMRYPNIKFIANNIHEATTRIKFYNEILVPYKRADLKRILRTFSFFIFNSFLEYRSR